MFKNILGRKAKVFMCSYLTVKAASVYWLVDYFCVRGATSGRWATTFSSCHFLPLFISYHILFFTIFGQQSGINLYKYIPISFLNLFLQQDGEEVENIGCMLS